MELRRFLSWATTHVGTIRTHNEDALVDRPDLGLWAVADGAGGHARGDVAAGTVVQALDSISPNLSAAEVLAQVRQKVADAHDALQAAQNVDNLGMSATTVVVLIARDDHYACLWAGDSRAYLLRDGQLQQLTRDHSMVQELVDAGAISADQAEKHPNANIITRAVGADSELDLDKVSNRLLAGDRFLLCSDGLNKALSEEELTRLLGQDHPTESLINAALAHNGRDNMTAVVIEILPGE
jgi:serine/threonine protein phosphatase Stp1